MGIASKLVGVTVKYSKHKACVTHVLLAIMCRRLYTAEVSKTVDLRRHIGNRSVVAGLAMASPLFHIWSAQC